MGKYLASAVGLCLLIIPADPGEAQSSRWPLSKWPQQIPVQPESTTTMEREILQGQLSDDARVVGIRMRATADGNQYYVCSGVLLAPTVVLTAAHCVCGMASFEVTNDKKIAQNTAWWRVAKPFVFGNFCTRRDQQGYDIAALILTTPAAQRNANTKLLDNGVADILRARPQTMRVEGYGWDGNVVDSVGQRRFGNIRINSVICTEEWSRSMGCSPLYEFIMGIALTNGRNVDTCKGDSGGPVFATLGGREYLVGIISRGLPLQHQYQRGVCGAGGIYSHLGRRDVVEWIRGLPR